MEYLQPCLQAVSYATKYLNSEALFLTATIKEYYNRLHGMNLDKLVGKTMSHYCEERNLTFKNIPFKSYAEDFNMIDNKTESIVIPQDENSRKTIESIKYNEFVSSRSLQKYTCTVSKSEFEELIKQKQLLWI